MRLTATERQVAGYTGVETPAVAAAIGCSEDLVRAARERLGRDLETGLPRTGPPSRRRGIDYLVDEDFDRLMRGNRSVCG